MTLRLIPFMFLLYVVAYLDRINVSFAALQMNKDLGFTDAVYGLGAGIFFIGYFLFEVPSNLILARTGARVWIARIMITWGIVSTAMMFVRTPPQFYVLRFVLGLAEAGFFPGMILYLTFWFPAADRARAVAWFMTATSMAGVIGGPISGALLELHLVGGLAGWQWLFLLEGIPSVLLGFVVFFYLTDRPEQARWLRDEERDWLVERMRQDEQHGGQHREHSLRQALLSGRVWLLCALYFTLVVFFYGIGFWLPKIIKASGDMSDLTVGMVSALPNLVAMFGMILIGGHSDRTGERRWHVALSAGVGAAGLALSAFLLGAPVLLLAALSLGLLGMRSTLGPFWALATSFLSGTAAAGSIALINSIGNLGGFVGPAVVGDLKERTGSYLGGLLFLAASSLLAAALVLCVRHTPGDGRASAP